MNNLSKIFRYENANGESVIFTYENNFIINKPKGIDSLSIRFSQAKGIYDVGSIIGSANIQSRPVNISGKIVGSEQFRSKDLLLSVVRPDIPGKLYADEWYLDVRPTSTPNISAEKQFAVFQFSLLAAYPYWKRDNTTSAKLGGIIPMFKFPWNISKPYQFGKKAEAVYFEVMNRGQVPIPFKVIIRALEEVVNPKLENITTGTFLILEKRIVKGEIVMIDITHDITTVTSTSDGDIRGALSLDSDFNRLAVGRNIIKPTAESGKDNMDLRLEFAYEIAGVSV